MSMTSEEARKAKATMKAADNRQSERTGSYQTPWRTDLQLNIGNTQPKSRPFLAVLLAVILALTGMTAISFADSNPADSGFSSDITRRSSGSTTKTDTTKGVYQGLDRITFGSPMVLSTIYIDMTKIKGQESTAIGEVLSNDNGFYIDNDNYATYDTTRNNAGKSAFTAKEMNDFPGQLFQFTYKDAAVLSDGSLANVRFIYSNAHVSYDVRATDYSYNGWVRFATGHQVVPTTGGSGNNYNLNLTDEQLAYTGQSDPNAYKTGYASVGLEIDVRIQVVDDEGNVIEGSFINPISGVNQRKTGASMFRSVYDTVGHEYYSEGVRLNSGLNSNIYVMGYQSSDPYYCISETQIEGAYEGATRFWAGDNSLSGGNGSNGNYNSGFITTADSAKGVSMTVTSGGNGSTGNQSYFLEGEIIWHRIISSTGPGGAIQTTTEGNSGLSSGDPGKLNDGGDIMGPGTYVVPDGKRSTTP